MKMEKLPLVGVLVLSLAWTSSATEGVSMRFYRNFFTRSMAELQERNRAGFAPDRVATLPSFELTDPWTHKSRHDISRCYAAVLAATVTADRDGACRLIVPAAGGSAEVFAAGRKLAFSPCKVGGGVHVQKVRGGKKTLENYLASEPLSLKNGEAFVVKAFFVPGWRDRFNLAWAWNAAGTNALVREEIPSASLAPVTDVGTKPFLTVGNAKLTGVHPDDDEPDSLCWDRFADEIPFVEHFYAWAKTHPAPNESGGRGATALPGDTDGSNTKGRSAALPGVNDGGNTKGRAVAPRPPQAHPYVWLKMGEMKLVANDGVWRNTNKVEGVTALTGPRSHNICSFCHFDAKVDVEGDYRLWCRYYRKSARSANTFNLTVTPMPGANPAEDDIDTVLTKFQQTFARTRAHNERCGDPTPEIFTVEPGPGGWSWESTHRTAHLRPGTYRFSFKTGQYPGGDGPKISDIVLTADGMLNPGVQTPCETSTQGTWPASEGVKNPLYAVRPGAEMNNVPAARLSWWRQWRDALYDKLADAEHTDYVWGYLATLNCFDEDSNLIGRVREVRSQKSVDAHVGATIKLTGRDFARENGWGENSHFARNYGESGNISHGEKTNESTFAEIELPEAGRYVLKVRYYGWNGAAMVSVVTADGKKHSETLVGFKGGRNNWAFSDVMDLPKGKARIVLTSCYNPKHGGKPAPKNYNSACVTRVILTDRLDAGVDNAEVNYPDGMTVGEGALDFWCQDPFNAFSRYSPPANWSWNQWGPDHWTPLPAEEIGKTDHTVDAISGEVKSQLLMIRNNTEKPIVIAPKLSSKLPASVRLVAYTVTSGGLWSPQILLNRAEVVCPAKQNTALWVSIDCRGAKEGTYPVALGFADKRVTWNVTVKGTFAGVPKPYLYPYARPYPRESCWALYKDYGLDVVSYVPMSKKAMKDYDIRLLIGISTGGLPFSDASVRQAIAGAEKLGQKPGDYTWYLIDEPSPKAVPRWMEMAKIVKNVDPDQSLWCNVGFGAIAEKYWDVYFPMMEYWDVSCPFKDHFSHAPQFAPYYEKLKKTGKIKLTYHTLDMGGTEKKLSAPKDLLDLADLAIREGLDGYANFSLMNGNPYDDLYMGNQDLAVSIYPGSRGRTLATRNLEAYREGGFRWRRAKMNQKGR